jgi:hypothetical protein
LLPSCPFLPKGTKLSEFESTNEIFPSFLLLLLLEKERDRERQIKRKRERFTKGYDLWKLLSEFLSHPKHTFENSSGKIIRGSKGCGNITVKE